MPSRGIGLRFRGFNKFKKNSLHLPVVEKMLQTHLFRLTNLQDYFFHHQLTSCI